MVGVDGITRLFACPVLERFCWIIKYNMLVRQKEFFLKERAQGFAVIYHKFLLIFFHFSLSVGAPF